MVIGGGDGGDDGRIFVGYDVEGDGSSDGDGDVIDGDCDVRKASTASLPEALPLVLALRHTGRHRCLFERFYACNHDKPLPSSAPFHGRIPPLPPPPLAPSLPQQTGNEADVSLYVESTGLMWENAPAFNALLVFAEHRYYGESLPFGAPNKGREFLRQDKRLSVFVTFRSGTTLDVLF